MIESIVTLFAVGTIGFWALVFIASIVFIVSVENDHYWFPSILTLGLVGIYWKPLVDAFDWRAFLIGLGIYAIAGMAWSAWRWFKHIKTKIEEYTELRDNLTQKDLEQWIGQSYSLTLSHNKSRIMGWIAWWPWSLFWNLTQDFFTTIYDAMKGIYEKIAAAVIAKAMAKLPVADKKKEDVKLQRRQGIMLDS